ncbi:MAG TPA: LysR family transcriptional regulator [Dongiaceae bacterium]|nr:LysR family transcriptional regulator [Dongiaceae bacterium]
MNRNHLALFHAVAEMGSISGAAARQHISQPAVSKQIRELEGELGVALLDRLSRGVRLTEAGRLLADYARRWTGLEREAGRAIAELRGLQRGQLSIGASTTIGNYLLPPVLIEFHRRHPRVDVRLEIANTRAIQHALLEGSWELGFTEGIIATEDLESEVFHRDELVIVVPPKHRLLALRRVTARDLGKEDWIMREEGSGTRDVVERALRKQRLKVSPAMALGSAEAIKQAVAAGQGVAMMSRLVVRRELAAGTLVQLAVPELAVLRPLHLQQLRGRSDSPIRREFLSILAAMLRPETGATTPQKTTPRR